MPIVAWLLAAIIINSYPANLTAGDSFSLSASASGLTASASYSLKIRIGSQSGSLTKGQTKSSSGDWLSDSGDSWANFPMITTDGEGFWSGSLVGRPSTDAFIGQNFIVLRLHGSTNYDSASVSAMVSPGSQQSSDDDDDDDDATDSESTATKPTFDWQPPAAGVLGESFQINLSLKDFLANTDYYLKIRAGPDESHLTKAQTKSGSGFFSDNESWGNFPLVKTDGAGGWDGQVFGLITEEKEEGIYKVRLRARKKDADTFHESETKEISFVKQSVSPSPSILPRATVSASSPSSTKNQYNLVLGTGSSSLASLPVPTKGEKTSVAHQRDWFSLGLIFSGLAISLGAMVLFFYKEEIWRRFYGIIKRE